MHCPAVRDQKTPSERAVLTQLLVFPIDETLKRWLRGKASEAAMLENTDRQDRINHERIDELFANSLTADSDAVYAKQLYLNLYASNLRSDIATHTKLV